MGQLTALLLLASGFRVVGIAIDLAIVEISGRYCLDIALKGDDVGEEEKIVEFTVGLRRDLVIIAVESGSLYPINEKI